MKAFLQKFVAFSMALLLLASTTSWKVEKHFCMGHLIDVAFFLDVEDCGMSTDLMKTDDSAAQIESSCCSEDVIFVGGQDDLTLTFDSLDLEQQSFLVVYVQSYIGMFAGTTIRITPHEHYPPPILVKDLQLLDQVFLI
ncbi:HYC_CC_PP family protein [Maribacter sp. HTCC2170]|uniref:HYC_CC_PP family protein n=1 Tax=Maribacter sp. (strain HTCC2170 / KCCM 42371) TaxID=313603 RepID=UPI00006AE621|nr:hypothetical protein FB2170_08569 [Maribacter sp. HTCC2170]